MCIYSVPRGRGNAKFRYAYIIDIGMTHCTIRFVDTNKVETVPTSRLGLPPETWEEMLEDSYYTDRRHI